MATPLYRRSTRALTLAEAPEALRGAVDEHARQHELALAGARAWLTHSENPPAEGFFGRLLGRRANSVDPDPWHDTLIVLLPEHLVVATSGPRRGTVVTSLALERATLKRGSALRVPGADLPGDDGLTIEGFPGEVGRPGSYFAGLGPPDADDCFTACQGALAARRG